MNDIEQDITDTIEKVQKARQLITHNGDLLRSEPAETEKILKSSERVTILSKVKNLLALRRNSLDILENFTNDEEKETVIYGNVELPFSYARIFALQAFLSCTWSIYDILTGFCGFYLAGESFANSNLSKNFNVKKLFIRAKGNDAKISPYIIVAIVTGAFGFEIDYFYLLRNIFLHTSGIELEDFFLESKTGQDAFSLAEAGITKLQNELDNDLKNKNSNHILIRERDLLKILSFCLNEVDKAFGILLHTSSELYLKLIESFILAKGGDIVTISETFATG